MPTNATALSEKDRILRRIKKCLALSRSDNENEAASALRQARALMERHGITMADASKPDIDVLDTSEGKRSRASLTNSELMLFSVVGEFFGCTVFSSNNWPVIVGEAPSPEIAQYASGTLLRQLRQNRKQAIDRLESTIGSQLGTSGKREFNDAYNRTWIYAVSKKVEAFAGTMHPEISVLHLDAVKKHWSMEQDVPMRSVRAAKDSPISDYAHLLGATDGKNAQLHHGVSAGPQQAMLQ